MKKPIPQYHIIQSILSALKDRRQMAKAIFEMKKADQHASHQKIKNHFISSNEKINATLKPTVCGPFVIASEKAMNDISSLDRKIRALDMEGFGLYSSAYKLRRSCLWIKGVADLGDKDKGDMFHERGSYASALFLYYMIKEFM